jgi:phage pi2 protein 07
MDGLLASLKQNLYVYRDLETRLSDIGKNVADLREQKREVEKSMASILAHPEFNDFKKLELKDDGTYVNIHRPGEWNKGWSLGKKELEECLVEYFTKHSLSPNAKECHEFICNKQKDKGVGKEFAFDHVIPKKK